MSLHELRQRYDADAAAYAVWWAPVLRDLGQRLVSRLDDALWRGLEVVVDVGCGTGLLLSELALRAPQATVVGVDASFGMLASATRHQPAVQADAQRLPLNDGSVDLVTSAFMLQHVADPGTVFAEWARVLRPGGVLALAAWVGLDEWPAQDILTEELDRVGAPAVPSTRQYGELVDTEDKLAALATEAGLRVERVDIQPLGWRPTAEETLGQLTSMRRTGTRFQALDPELRATVYARAMARLAEVELDSSEDVCSLYARA
jgi:SAM-dependent methyltransferase